MEKDKKKHGTEFAAETLTGDMMKFIVDTLKGAKDVWQKLSEADQRLELDRIQQHCDTAVKKCVQLIANTKEWEIITAQVDTVTFKKGATAKLKIPTGQGNDFAHSLARAEGGYVDILIPHADVFANTGTAPKPDKDQPELIGDEEQEDEKLDALYPQAYEFVTHQKKTAIGALQKHLHVGYNRAARIIQQLENEGVLGPLDDKGRREIFF